MSLVYNSISIVVPTYNETPNIRPLCERLFGSIRNHPELTAELIYVDDESPGSDETKRIVDSLVSEGFPVRIYSRKRRDGRGLSSAVLIGFDIATHPVVVCMDADLQHEPESVYSVALPVLTGRAEFTVGSRYCHDRGFGFDWAPHRRLISAGATLLARGVSTSTDPMSGFFATTKRVISRGRGKINSIGFKIALEIMCKCRAYPVVDVPITFQTRTAGESKLTMRQNIEYIQQLIGLYWDNFPIGLISIGIFILFFIFIFINKILNLIK
jgi:dolichol-phosphate mannosyltransferase